jgi:hypothetical protein
MKKVFSLILCGAALLLTGRRAEAGVIPAGGGSSTCTITGSGMVSCTGSLDAPEDVFAYTFTTTASDTNITVQTYGFGGGTNAAGATISAGGFDSLVALFSGPADAASILMSGGNPVGSDPTTTQFFSGCGPAGTVEIGDEAVCADNTLTADNLGPGQYTLLLADADFIPYAFANGDPSLFDLTDTTSGNVYADFASAYSPAFQTCNDEGDCINTNGNFAVDIDGLPAPVPEPGTWAYGAGALAWLGVFYRRRR